MAFTVGGESFTYRFKITVDKDKVPANQTNFATYYDLSEAPAGFFTNVKPDGGDIRVTQSDGTTQQALEIVFITVGSSIGEIHFNASSISSSVDTDFYIYYGNAGASQPAANATYGSENVWDANYELVWHCQEDPTGAGAVLDSTGNSYDGTGASGMGSDDLVAGALSGYGYDFDEATAYVSAANDIWTTTDMNNGVTVSAWISGVTSALSVVVDIEGFFSIHSITNKYRLTTDGGVAYRTQSAGSGAGYHLLTCEHTNNGGTSNLFVDDEATLTGSTGTCAISTVSRPFRIGAWSSTGGFQFAGQIDEVRVSVGVVRGEDFHDTMYNNQSSVGTFFTTGGEEESTVTFVPKVMIF
jgi:hypothetical protein